MAAPEIPHWLAWISLVGGLGAVVANIVQGVQAWLTRKLRSQEREQDERELIALKKSLILLRANFTQAVDTREVIKSEAATQWVRSMGFHVRSMEVLVDAILRRQESLNDPLAQVQTREAPVNETSNERKGAEDSPE